MSIDMKDYAGEFESLAAVEQQEQNSYQRNEYEFPVLPPDTQVVDEVESKASSQEQPEQREDTQALNFKALSESVERLKAERETEKREHQLQIEMLRANQIRREPEQAKQMFDGMEDNEIPNVGEFRKAWSEREKAYNDKIEELQVANQFSDYAEILNKHGKHLAETDPLFLQGLKSADNKALFAYQYAKKEQRIQDLEAQLKSPPQQVQKSNDAQRMVANSRKPGTLSQAGGQNILSKADYFETMSDADFMKFATKHLESI